MLIRLYSGKKSASLTSVCLLASALITAGCANTDKRLDTANQPGSTEVGHVDPYEGFNRSMYGFNMGLDKYFFKPVADGYKWVTPDFVETGVSNFFNNLKGINVVLNDVLQGKFQQGAADAGRFLTNTTLGVAGLVDVASGFGLSNNIEDFGQTLAVWGVAEGPYLVLPIMGPTTMRDGSGLIVDKAANPGTYVPGTGIIEGINDRANAEAALNFINEAALDPYVFTRESFLQYRRHLVNDGKSDNHNYDWDIETDSEKTDASGIVQATPAQNAASDDKTIATGHATLTDQIRPANRSAFDDMLQSFEQASTKLDQLSLKKSNKN